MTQGYGPNEPEQPGSSQPPQYDRPPQYGQPPAYEQPAQPGYGGTSPYPSAPAGAGYGQPGYTTDQPGFYMGRPLASWIQRVGAYLIDGLIQAIPAIILVTPYNLSATDGSPSVGLGILAALGWLLSLGIWIYNRWIMQGQTGQSWGKKALNLRLVRMSDGQPIGPLMAFVRDICHFLDGICLVGYIYAAFDARRQTFADKILSTVVLAEQR
ncbi:MAG TPA: RDD family protein [Actinomycetes bacterium]|jgi:uncharacterized RDD family membrane protein YckC|nr:RDD family protein [Actinomycetes bacterium]